MKLELDAAILQRLGRPWWLALALGMLHLGLLQGIDSAIGRGLLLGHLGAVLVWQPLVSGARRLSLLELVLGGIGIAAVWWGMSWGLTLVWMLLLAGILGGRIFLHARARDRLPYWLALGYLVLAMLCLVLPQLLPPGHESLGMLRSLLNALSIPVLFGVLVLGGERVETRGPVALDFVGSLVIVLVLAGVMLGTLALMFVDGRDYQRALLQSLAVMAGGLMLLGWSWNPRRGFQGLGLAISRHVLSGGRPLERWLEEVADSAAQVQSPVELVSTAAQRMVSWPGVLGVRWQVSEPAALAGEAQAALAKEAEHWQWFAHGAVRMEVGTREALPVATQWQLNLMMRVLAEFHRAALQAQRLQSLSYLRAVHETGARVTHEVKNLLQSLDTLCFAVAETNDVGDELRERARDALIRRQLPAISQRLHEALSRIRTPDAAPLQPRAASQWWADLCERHAGEGVAFELDAPPDALAQRTLPAGLFDVVADNLLRNALEKPPGAAGQRVRIVCSLRVENEACVMAVEDDGAAIAVERASLLFHTPLPSETGFGVGLYQCAQMATAAGYSLQLRSNRDGCVRFELSLVAIAAVDPAVAMLSPQQPG